MNENLQMILGGIIIMVGFGAAIAYPRLQDRRCVRCAASGWC